MNNLEEFLDISEEVKEALHEKKAVVALESTIISHGMPYPENVESALNSEKNIRENNAVPATIAIIKGRIKVGLNKEELEYMGSNKNIAKSSRRDLPVMLALKKDGATTVTTTMIGASLAGIKVFATGGIGGVHRYAQETFDISADLQELSKTNVAVVCAGAKSILDIGLTIEYLETFGIPVLGYKTENFPAFYTRESGYKVDYKIDTTKDIANILNTKWSLGLNGGVLVCNPIPEEYEMDKDYINKIIDETVKEARDKNISGKDVTPYILAKLHSVTENKSLKALRAPRDWEQIAKVEQKQKYMERSRKHELHCLWFPNLCCAGRFVDIVKETGLRRVLEERNGSPLGTGWYLFPREGTCVQIRDL